MRKQSQDTTSDQSSEIGLSSATPTTSCTNVTESAIAAPLSWVYVLALSMNKPITLNSLLKSVSSLATWLSIAPSIIYSIGSQVEAQLKLGVLIAVMDYAYSAV